ncbi:MAG TPA: alpha/beta hydrolase [Pirellulaceae bacterium]|nr:alpha/beta hydrolase [Pirellulaceae bacterium]
MKPLHLQIQLDLDAAAVTCLWFGSSAIHAVGSLRCVPRAVAETQLVPAPCLIDLQPLLAEIADGTIASAEALAEADELLLIRDLLELADFTALAEALFRFLYAQTQQREALPGYRKAVDGRVWIDPDQRLVRVWFATDRRAITDDDIVRRFDSQQSSDEITYGVCSVFIPKSHKPGSTGTPWWRRWIRLEADDSLRLDGLHALPRDVFWAGMANKLKAWWKAGERNVFVYIHGFNVSFEAAAIGAAQIGYDLKVPGEMAFYSWPSHGSTAAYSADEATITASVKHLARFLHELSTRCGAERLHLFVHSMGNRGLLSALERLVAKGYPQLSLGQVFFCAPDEDVRTFKDKAAEFPHHCENRTLLVSPQDQAVFLSQWKHRLDRVGYVPPVTIMDGIDTIEVGGFGILDLGHGYFAQAEPVIKDMREAITTRRPAAERKIPRSFEDHYVIDVRAGIGDLV